MKYDFNEVHNRLGTYCTQWDYIQDRFNKKDLIPFSISDTDFIIPKPITEKIFEVAHHQIYGYTRWNHHDFKSSITGYFERRHHTHIEEDWILYSPTVMYSVSLLIRLLSQPHDKVLTFEPMYDSFYTVIQDNDRQLVAHRLISKDGTFEIDFDLFEKQVQECQLLLLCSPHNPTGRIWTKEEMDQIIKICKKDQVKIISDEIHIDIQLRDRKHIPLLSYIHEYDELYTAASSSKTFNTPGLIGSYLMIPNEEVREKFLMHTRRKDFLNSVSIFGMYATMIGYTQCDDYIDQLNDYIKENMKIVEEFIKDLQSKNYTYAGLSRVLMHIALNIKQEDVNSFISNGYVFYARVLGFNRDTSLMRLLKMNASIDLIGKFSSYYNYSSGLTKKMLNLSLQADDLYRLVYMNKCQKKIPREFQRKVIVL